MQVISKSIKTAAVVVTFNRKELLLKCLDALLLQTSNDFLDIIIIDNASTDGTYEELIDYIDGSKVQYFNTGSNLGGAGGFCFGIKLATELGYGSLWILDDDTMPTLNALEELRKRDNDLGDAYGYLSSKVLWKDDTICTMNIQKETKWKRLKEFDKEKTIQYASFVSMFLRTKTVHEIGLPYKDFFIWADDWEYTRRISKVKPCYFLPQSVVKHWCASNVGADIINASSDRINRFNYMYRNDVVLYRQDGLEGRFYLALRNMMHRLKILLKADNKFMKLKIISRGTREGSVFYPQIEYPEINNGDQL